jgi:adenylate cyclase
MLAPLIGAVITAGLGLVCYLSDLGKPLERLSYDLPFPLRKDVATKDIAIIYLDEGAARALGQPLDLSWDRRIFARLLDRLNRDGAKLVCFDLVFSTPSADAAADEEFARAITRQGKTILGADYREHEQFGVQVAAVEKATPLLRQSQAGWGLLAFRPIDPDGAIRQLCLRYQDIPSFAMAAASHAGVAFPENSGAAPIRWLNYYGPAGEAFEGVSIADALREDGVPPGFFRNRTVFVGGRYSTGSLRAAKDEFGNPYSRWGRRFTPGVEVHATAFLNLVRSEWLRRPAAGVELAILLAIGLFSGAGLCLLRPHWALAVTLITGTIIFVGSCLLVWHRQIWFPWALPVALQLPVALGWSVGSQYFTETKRRSALRNAFSYYLSPHMADQIAQLDFSLKPGGKLAEVTVLFTDCKGFTSVSEELNDPLKISELLIEYFTQTSRCVLDNGGTILKYVGDCVMAAWGAPLDDSDHPRKATLAGWQLSEASKVVVKGRVLTTRVGLSTGMVVAGNLGSPYRFDYTVIGDTVNLASRLEGLNKLLNTSVLISESTQSRVGQHFVTRLVGHFAVAGKSHGVAVHEVLGTTASKDLKLDWLGTFNEAMNAIKSGAFADANALFRKSIWERGGEDGPSEFYLRKIADLEQRGRLREWTGVVKLDEK